MADWGSACMTPQNRLALITAPQWHSASLKWLALCSALDLSACAVAVLDQAAHVLFCTRWLLQRSFWNAPFPSFTQSIVCWPLLPPAPPKGFLHFFRPLQNSKKTWERNYQQTIVCIRGKPMPLRSQPGTKKWVWRNLIQIKRKCANRKNWMLQQTMQCLVNSDN